MPFGKLSDSQKEIARMVSDEARAQGINPELALAIAFAESRFNPAALGPQTKHGRAYGVMQVLDANAPGLGLKVEDLTDPQKNINAGVRILKENLNNHKGNTLTALVGYNASPSTAKRFASSGLDVAVLPAETKDYLEKINGLFDYSQDPYYTPPEGEAAPLIDVGGLPPDIDKPINEPSNLEQTYLAGRAALSNNEGDIDKTIAALGGAGVGLLAGTAETATRTGGKLMDLLKTPEEIRNATIAKNASSVGNPSSPGQKWAAKTGYGAGTGETVEDVASQYKRATQGKYSKSSASKWGLQRPGEPEDIYKRMLYKAELQKKVEQEAMARAAQLEKEAIKANKISKMGTLARIPFIGPAIAGGSAGYDIADAIDRYEHGDTSGAVIQALGGLGSAAALIPHPMTRAIGTGVGMSAVPAVMLNDYLKRKP